MTINTFTIINGVVGLNVSSVEAHWPRNSLYPNVVLAQHQLHFEHHQSHGAFSNDSTQ
jgi:hypothetical protein